MQLIKDKGGQESVRVAGDTIGLSAVEVATVADLVSPLMIQKLQERMRHAAGRNWLRRQRDTGGCQQFLDRPFLMTSSAVEIDGGRILNRLIGKQAIVELVGLHIAKRTGINVAKIRRLLPAIGVLFVGAVCKGLGDAR